MGSIVCEYSNRIVELENEIERKEARRRLIRISVTAAFFSLLLSVCAGALDMFSIYGKLALIIGTASISLGIYEHTRDDHSTIRVRTAVSLGITISAMAMLTVSV